MNHPIAFIARGYQRMPTGTESKRCNELVHGPPCTRWPPAWLESRPPASATPSEIATSPHIDAGPPSDAGKGAVLASGRVPAGLPASGELVVYDAKYRFGREMSGEPYMWTAIGATRWY